MKTINEELLSKWIDQCLSPAEQVEVDAALKDDPSLLAEVESLRALGSGLKAEFPVSQEPPYPDFFNTQLMNKIGQIAKEDTSSAPAPAAAADKLPWYSRIGLGWLPASALAAVLAFFAGTKMDKSPEVITVAQVADLPTVYAPGQKHDARIISDSSGEVTAIVMSGLDAIGDDVDFATANLSVVLPERYLISLERQTL